MHQCKELFARLVRMLLGEAAISESKLVAGLSLVVLGILVKPDKDGVFFCLCPEKTKKWLEVLKCAVEAGRLNSGEAQKLSGKLMWYACTLHVTCPMAVHFSLPFVQGLPNISFIELGAR